VEKHNANKQKNEVKRARSGDSTRTLGVRTLLPPAELTTPFEMCGEAAQDNLRILKDAAT